MAKAPKAPENFDEALKQLETLIQTMEQDTLPLEASIQTYKQGMELVRFCQAKLNDAEQQLKVLEDGELKPLDLN